MEFEGDTVCYIEIERGILVHGVGEQKGITTTICRRCI